MVHEHNRRRSSPSWTVAGVLAGSRGGAQIGRNPATSKEHVMEFHVKPAGRAQRGVVSAVDAKTNFGNEGAIFFLPRGLHCLAFFLPHDLHVIFSFLPHDLLSRVSCAGASGGVEQRLGRGIGRVRRVESPLLMAVPETTMPRRNRRWRRQ